jgi:hypothetical protein
MKCENCRHWKPTGYDYGECHEMKDKVSVDLITGWEGALLNAFETENDFGCVLFKEKE